MLFSVFDSNSENTLSLVHTHTNPFLGGVSYPSLTFSPGYGCLQARWRRSTCILTVSLWEMGNSQRATPLTHTHPHTLAIHSNTDYCRSLHWPPAPEHTHTVSLSYPHTLRTWRCLSGVQGERNAVADEVSLACDSACFTVFWSPSVRIPAMNTLLMAVKRRKFDTEKLFSQAHGTQMVLWCYLRRK